MGFEGILNQIFQPYFYYSVIFLSVTFVCVKILTRYCNFIGQRTKSLLYLLPLALPLAVMLVAFPSASIQTHIETTKAITTGRVVSSFPLFPPPPIQTAYLTTITTVTVTSVTGIIGLVGIVAGALLAISMILADDRVARKLLHVISLSPEDHPWLQAKIAESAKKLAISTPQIGIVEDLRPNAFTIGYGKRATIVFSIGLLNILDEEEVIAVASHELAHVKNNDFFFKTISNALTTLSFFNPLSYFASSSAQREREMLADEHAIELLDKPSALANALAKICKSIQNLPKESRLVNLSSNLLVSSSVLHRVGILSTHPRLDKRLRNISAPKPKSQRWSKFNTQFALLLSIILILSAVAVSLAMADLQLNVTAQLTSAGHFVSGFKTTANTMGQVNVTLLPNPASTPLYGGLGIPVLIYHPNKGAEAVPGFAEGMPLNSQGPRAPGIVVVAFGNSSAFAQMHPSNCPQNAVWIG